MILSNSLEGGEMGKLGDIEQITKEYAAEREALTSQVKSLEEEIAVCKRKYIGAIKKAVEITTEKRSLLYAAIEESPELFIRPKTMILYGIRIGYMKSKGRYEWDDEEQVIKLIKRHFPDTWEEFINATEKVVKGNLGTITANDLKRLGVRVIADSDEVVIKGIDSEIDKLVEALLKDTTATEVKEAA